MSNYHTAVIGAIPCSSHDCCDYCHKDHDYQVITTVVFTVMTGLTIMTLVPAQLSEFVKPSEHTQVSASMQSCVEMPEFRPGFSCGV